MSVGGHRLTLIAESNSSRTEWCLVEGGDVKERAFTEGLNPFFMSRREVSHIVRLQLPEVFFRRRWEHVFFYGAGCSNVEKRQMMEASLIAQFKTPATVFSDLEGAARGLLIREPGLACIIGTGSNSCLYDGERIVKNVRPLGFILGDEGSGAAMGRIFVGDCLKNLAPQELAQEFYEQYKITPDAIMDSVYNNPQASRNLTEYSFFLARHLHNDYVRALVANELMRFFERNISQYDYEKYDLSVVGEVGCKYTEILLDVAQKFGVKIKKVVRDSMPGLILYHSL
ncbi:MAG: hypothetical protein J6X81_05775 [Muribaculaceae bacterium]|nr:hypothetical protein [Muribaculaceae bacterium]